MVDRILFDAFANSCEGLWIADGDFGQDLAVELDVLALHAVDQLAVADTVFAGSVVDTGNPQSAEIAFAVAAVAIGVAERLDNTLLRKTEAAGAVVLHAFRGFKDLFVLCVCGDTSFNSHRLGSQCSFNVFLDAAFDGRGALNNAFAGLGFLRKNVVAVSTFAHNLTGWGNANTLLGALVGLEFWHLIPLPTLVYIGTLWGVGNRWALLMQSITYGEP